MRKWAIISITCHQILEVFALLHAPTAWVSTSELKVVYSNNFLTAVLRCSTCLEELLKAAEVLTGKRLSQGSGEFVATPLQTIARGDTALAGCRAARCLLLLQHLIAACQVSPFCLSHKSCDKARLWVADLLHLALIR